MDASLSAAPGDARFQLELADRYARRGKDKQATEVLARLQQRFPSDAGVIAAIADLYQRWGKEDLAIAQFEKLAKIRPFANVLLERAVIKVLGLAKDHERKELVLGIGLWGTGVGVGRQGKTS